MEALRNKVRELLIENGWKCNADGRKFIADRLSITEPRTDNFDVNAALEAAIKIGSQKPGTTYRYFDANGDIARAQVYDLYDIPAELTNPFVICFSGMMTAHLYAMEAVRYHAMEVNELLPIFCTGKEGNKGLFKNVFDRTEGVMVQTEAEAYLRPLSYLAPEAWVRLYQRAVADIDTKGNFDEMYNLAKELGLGEITVLLCSGNFSYETRLLAEGMLALRNPKYADVTINLAVLHCPVCTDLAVPEGHFSELFWGYIAASVGPLMKDAAPLTIYGEKDEKAERYLLPGTAEADWEPLREVITHYSNMGWPNYQELLYGVEHEEAVINIILSDLYARASFTPEGYDKALLEDIKTYQDFVGTYEKGTDFQKFLEWSTDYKFFND